VVVDPGPEPSKKADTGISSPPQAVVDERYQTWVDHSRNVKKLYDAGIPFALASGSMGLSDFLKNVRRIIGTGVPREKVLAALTVNAANLLGVADRVGSIEPGKLANLTITNGDFADDKTAILGVVVEGKKFEVNKGISTPPAKDVQTTKGAGK
jgi:imidazolonepropionase-like amidohydrolase